MIKNLSLPFKKRRKGHHPHSGWSQGRGAYHFNLTTPGWFFFLLMVLIMGAAVASGHNLLYLVVCLFFGSFIVMGNVAVMNLQGLSVKREIPESVYAETPTPVAIHIENNRTWMDSFALEVRETPSEKKRSFGKVYFPLVTKAREMTRTYQLNLPHRGWHDFKGLEVVTRFPFGFWERSREMGLPERVLAFPRIYQTWPEAMANLTIDGEFVGNRWGSGDELLNFRDYMAGDPVRWIHWKNTAKMDRLTVALYHHPKNRHVVVCLRTHYPKGTRGNIENHFEEAVSWAATAITKLLEKGVNIGYTDETARIVPSSGEGQKIRLLSHLALVEIVWTEERDEKFHEGISSRNQEILMFEATPTGVKIDSGSREQHFEEAPVG